MKKLTIVILFSILSVTAYAQNKLSLGVNGEVAVPMDLFGDVANTGFGGNAGVFYNLNENFDLSLSIGYLTWSFKEDFGTDVTYSAIPIMAGIKYYFSAGNFKPYAALDLGLHITSLDVPAADTSASESKGAWGIGLGFITPLSGNIDLDVSAKLKGNGTEITIGDEDSGNYEKATVMFFGINAGVRIKL